jgi:peptidyl-prolyl cis-trans isomerase D
MVRETPYVAPGDDVPNIGSSQQFEQGIEPLQNPQDVGERTPIKNGFAIPMLIDKKEPNRIPDFEEIKEKVLTAYRRERAEAQLEETARNLAGSVNTAGDLSAAAGKLGLEAKTQPSFGLSLPIGEMDTNATAREAIYAMKEGDVTKTPLKLGDNWVVLGVTKRKEADLGEFAKQRDQLVQGALMERRSQVFEDYVQAVQARMESEGRIKIYNEVIAQLGGNEPTISSQPPGQPPVTSMPIEIPAK